MNTPCLLRQGQLTSGRAFMKKLFLLAFLAFGSARLVYGGTETPAVSQYTETNQDWFEGRSFELELMTGVVGAPISGDHISYHFTDTQLRLGWMLYTPRWSGLMRGNLELLLSAGGGVIFEGPGDGFGSVGVILRYNFVQPSARIIPYGQIGIGTFISDISEDKQQEDIGSTFEADLKVGIGTRVLISRDWSFNLELYFDHISNAGAEDRNVGINALGGLVGLSRSF
jgi:hypothetical protein